MSSSQISYPVRLLLRDGDQKKSLSLRKGPQREVIPLDHYKIRLIRNGFSLQPLITGESSGQLRSLTLWIPLQDRWTPLIRREETSTHTTLLLRNSQNSVLQIYAEPHDRGIVSLDLGFRGSMVRLSWIIDCALPAGEELALATVHMTRREKRVEPLRYSLKDPAASSLNRGRLFPIPPSPSPEDVKRDVARLQELGASFDFYIFDYGTSAQWGDWTRPAPWVGDNPAALYDRVKALGAIPGIRLSPLTCSRRSETYRNGRDLLLGGSKRISVKSGGKEITLYPLDITREEVRRHIISSLDYHVSRGIRFIHLDHLDLLFSPADWAGRDLDPRRRLHLMTDILEPYRKRGVRFSTTPLPLTGLLDKFDGIFAFLTRGANRLQREDWRRYGELINLAVSLKNPPPLSLGGLRFSGKSCALLAHTQALMNGPVILADPTDDLNGEVLAAWKSLIREGNSPLLPLDISEISLTQGVLLLMNRQKMMTILNLSRSSRVVALKEGEPSGGKSFSPSESTSLRSQELILKMNRESSYFFRI